MCGISEWHHDIALIQFKARLNYQRDGTICLPIIGEEFMSRETGLKYEFMGKRLMKASIAGWGHTRDLKSNQLKNSDKLLYDITRMNDCPFYKSNLVKLCNFYSEFSKQGPVEWTGE